MKITKEDLKRNKKTIVAIGVLGAAVGALGYMNVRTLKDLQAITRVQSKMTNKLYNGLHVTGAAAKADRVSTYICGANDTFEDIPEIVLKGLENDMIVTKGRIPVGMAIFSKEV